MEIPFTENGKQPGDVGRSASVLQALGSLLEGCMLLGFDWTYLYVNDAAAQQGRQQRENLIGRTILEMYPGVEQSDVFHRYRVAMEQRVPQRFESEYTFADGTTNWFEFSVEPVPEGIFVLSLDVTERRQVEQELRKSEERFRQAMEASNDGLWDWDITNDSGYFSPSYYRMLGYEPNEFPMTGQGWADLIHPDDYQRVLSINQDCIENRRQSFEVEYRMKAKDGSLKWILGRGKALLRDAQGHALRMIGTHVDITERKQATEALAEFSRDFEAFLEQTTDFIYFKDRESRFRFCSETLAKITGHTSWRDMIGKHDLEVFPPDTARIYYEEELPIFAEGKPLLYKIDPYYDANGQLGYVLTNKWPLLDEHGKVVGIFGISRDITEQKRNEARLQLAASVFSHAREGIMITDAAGAIVEVNDTFTLITGYSREEAVGQNSRLFNSGLQVPEYYTEMWRALIEEGYWSGEIWNRHKSGEEYGALLTISAVRNAEGRTQNYVALFSDITQMKEHQRQLEHIAHHDGLTNLPNRVLLIDRLQQAMTQSQRRNHSLAVVYLDLDGFKAVNDQHGHDVGDELLIVVAKRLKEALREGDTLARIGGDEFVAVLVDLEHPQDCEPILARLLQAAADPVSIRQLQLQVSASIGVTICPHDGADADLLMRHADQAMYQAKQGGKNRCQLFEPEQDRKL